MFDTVAVRPLTTATTRRVTTIEVESKQVMDTEGVNIGLVVGVVMVSIVVIIGVIITFLLLYRRYSIHLYSSLSEEDLNRPSAGSQFFLNFMQFLGIFEEQIVLPISTGGCPFSQESLDLPLFVD